MPCNPLLSKAFKGIEFEHKLERVIAELPDTTTFNTETMKKYLTKKGVSPKEMEQSGILDMYKGDYKLSAKDWKEDFKHGGKFTEQDVTGMESFGALDGITLGRNGVENKTYKETMTQIPNTQPGNPRTLRHYQDINTGSKTNLGWRRVHVDHINGKDTTVLNEFQSDWAQYERDGYGAFKSSKKYTQQEGEQLQMDLNQKLIEAEEAGDKEQQKLLNDQIDKISMNMTEGDVINDFPISQKKFHQMQIVKAIDESIKNGTGRVAIPIQRENELVGSDKVTNFYDMLDKSILPDIRKKLDKQGLKLKVTREKYEASPDNIYAGGSTEDWDAIAEKMQNDGLSSTDVDEYYEVLMGSLRDNNWNQMESMKYMDEWAEAKYPDKGYTFASYADTSFDNELHVIEVIETPDSGKVKWDMYGIMGALGLEKYAEGEEDGL